MDKIDHVSDYYYYWFRLNIGLPEDMIPPYKSLPKVAKEQWKKNYKEWQQYLLTNFYDNE